MTTLGLGHAFAPISADDEIVGLIGIMTTDLDQAQHLVADLPSVSEAEAVADAVLAPMLVARQRTRMAKERIADAIASGAFQMVFQPIVDFETGLTVGFEALTRFASGQAPDEVFADATAAGLGAELETATLTAALRDADRLPDEAWLALNVSPTFLAESTQVVSILAQRTRPITLEITEHEVIKDYAPIRAAMAAIGPDVRLAVDDAGAGAAELPPPSRAATGAGQDRRGAGPGREHGRLAPGGRRRSRPLCPSAPGRSSWPKASRPKPSTRWSNDSA